MSSINNQQPHRRDSNRPRFAFLSRIESHIQGRTLGGLMELVPLLVTAIVLLFIIRYADAFVRPLALVAGQPWDFPGIGLIVAVIIFYLVGLLLTTRVGRGAMTGKDWLLNRIPVVKTLYGVTQQATSSLSAQYGFTRVVFVEWPRDGVVALGFLTGRAQSESGDRSMVVVYIPTVPNPTSGNLAFVMEDDVMETNLSVEDAMKLVFSGGIILPSSISLARVPRQRNELEFNGRFETDTK